MDDVIRQADQYRQHTMAMGYGHYTAGKRAAKRHMFLGLPVVIITSVVGTSIFATLSRDPEDLWKIITGIVSLSASVLAALQTFFGFSDRAAKHKTAGAHYGALRREIELFLLRNTGKDVPDREKALVDLEQIAKRLGQLADESPDLADELYEQGSLQMSERSAHDG